MVETEETMVTLKELPEFGFNDLIQLFITILKAGATSHRNKK